MDNTAILPFLKAKVPLFSGLTDQQLSLVLSISELKTISKGTFFINEGERENDIYLILEGEAEVLKKAENHDGHRLFSLKAGDSVGELALIDNAPRSASVRAVEDSKILVLPLAKLVALAEHETGYALIEVNLSKQLAQKLRHTNEITVKSLQAELWSEKRRAETGRFLLVVCILSSSWIFLVSILQKDVYALKHSFFITSPVILIILGLFIGQMRKSVYPLSHYGLNLTNWKKNILESILFTLPIFAILIAVKDLLISYDPPFEQLSLITFHRVDPSSPLPTIIQIITPFLYVLFTPLQELIARGIIQSSIEDSLSQEKNAFWAIILSNLLFAAFHSHLSPAFALAAFFGGLFWGWLYARQRSLLGPIISHALVGACLAPLGLDVILMNL